MWDIIQTISMSILVIIAFHYSYQYLRDTLTPKKTKDLVGFQNQKFDEIIAELQQARQINNMESELLEFAYEQVNNISEST